MGFRERAAPYITDMARCPVLAPPLAELIGPLAELIAGTSVRERLPQIEAAVADGVSALVLRVLADPAGSRRMGAAARRFVEQELGLQRMIDEHDRVYRRLVRSHGQGGVAVVAAAR